MAKLRIIDEDSIDLCVNFTGFPSSHIPEWSFCFSRNIAPYVAHDMSLYLAIRM